MTFSKLGADIMREYATDGVPASGQNKPVKADMRDWMATVEGFEQDIIDLQSGSTTRLVYNVREYGATGNPADDQTTAIQDAIDAAEAAGGGIVYFPVGTYRWSSTLTIQGSGITLHGEGRTLLGQTAGSILDGRVAAGHQIVIGTASPRIYRVGFRNLHLMGDNTSASFQFIETRNVRGVTLQELTFGNIYGLAKFGRSGEDTAFIDASGIEGNLAAVHGHFFDFVNVSGAVWIHGHGSIEGNTTIVANTSFANWEVGSTRSDGVDIADWLIRLFDRGVNLREGMANTRIFDMVMDDVKTYGVYADTDEGAIGSLVIHNNIINIQSPTVTSIGVFISATTFSAEDIQITGNLVTDSGDQAFWVTGAMTMQMVGNYARNAGQRTHNNFAAFRIGSSVKGLCSGNVSYATTANRPQSGFAIETNNADLSFSTADNKSIGHASHGINNSGGAVLQPLGYPLYPAGRYLSGGFWNTASVSAAAVTAGRLYAVPFFVTTPTMFTRIGVEVTVGAGNVRLGIYRPGGTSLPGDLLLDCGVVSVATSGTKEITIAQYLDPGLYYLAAVFDGTPTVQMAAMGLATYGYLGAASVGADSSVMYRAFAYAALPTPWGTPTHASGNTVALFMRTGV